MRTEPETNHHNLNNIKTRKYTFEMAVEHGFRTLAEAAEDAAAQGWDKDWDWTGEPFLWVFPK